MTTSVTFIFSLADAAADRDERLSCDSSTGCLSALACGSSAQAHRSWWVAAPDRQICSWDGLMSQPRAFDAFFDLTSVTSAPCLRSFATCSISSSSSLRLLSMMRSCRFLSRSSAAAAAAVPDRFGGISRRADDAPNACVRRGDVRGCGVLL